MGWVYFRISMKVEELNEIIDLTLIGVGFDIVDITATLLFLKIVMLINETSLVKIANDNLSRSVLKELIIFPFRQSVLFILIISHLIFRMMGTPIILIRKKLK